MSICKACGKKFQKKYNSQKYCSDDCRDVMRKQQYRNASHRYYHKHKHEWDSIRRYGVGTGTLGPHAREEFTEEHEIIKKELVRLRLKGNV